MRLIPITIDENGQIRFIEENITKQDIINAGGFIINTLLNCSQPDDKVTAKEFKKDNSIKQEFEKENKELNVRIKAYKEANERLNAKNGALEKQNEELDSLLQAAKEEIKRIKTENELSLEKYQNRSEVERIDNKLTIKKYIKDNLVNTQSYTILENGEIFKEYGMRQLTENIGTKEGKEKFYQAMYKTDFKFNVVLQYLYNTQHWIAKAYVMEFLPVQKDETPDLSMFREQLLKLIALHEQYYQSVAHKNYKFMDE